MGAVHHIPFSRFKSMFADLTEEDARAKGYFKGNFKKEEVFGLLRRSTSPTTVYKKQKLDRDDVIDITSFDVVAWLKQEMRLKLNRELALAYRQFDQATAPELVESCIYRISAAKARCDYYLRVLKAREPVAAGSAKGGAVWT